MSSEWMDWVEHDGKGCPCRGKTVQIVHVDGTVVEGVAGSSGHALSWDKRYPLAYLQITRYRIRKPEALLKMIKEAEGGKCCATFRHSKSVKLKH